MSLRPGGGAESGAESAAPSARPSWSPSSSPRRASSRPPSSRRATSLATRRLTAPPLHHPHAFYLTPVPIRPRSRGERRSLRTFSPGVSHLPPLRVSTEWLGGFNKGPAPGEAPQQVSVRFDSIATRSTILARDRASRVAPSVRPSDVPRSDGSVGWMDGSLPFPRRLFSFSSPPFSSFRLAATRVALSLLTPSLARSVPFARRSTPRSSATAARSRQNRTAAAAAAAGKTRDGASTTAAAGDRPSGARTSAAGPTSAGAAGKNPRAARRRPAWAAATSRKKAAGSGTDAAVRAPGGIKAAAAAARGRPRGRPPRTVPGCTAR